MPKAVPPLIAVALAAATAFAVYTVLQTDYTGPRKNPTDYLEEFPPTDPKLIKYRETDRIETGLKRVRGLAVGAAGKLYVAGDDVIRVFDGAKRTDIKTETPVNCLGVAKDGTVYAATEDHVEVYAPDGTRKAAWPGPGTVPFLTSVAVTEESVYVGDAGNRVILRYDSSGRLLQRIRKQDADAQIDGVLMPSMHFDVAVRPGGGDALVRANDPGRLRVDVYTADGDLMASWGKASVDLPGFGGCCNPTDVAVLPDGRVVTSEKGEARVKVYTAEGKFDGVVAGPESFPKGWCSSADCTRGKALDLAVDGSGRIYVLDPTTATVRIFVPTEGDKP